MKYRTRIQYTETDKALMWERWRQGESLQQDRPAVRPSPRGDRRHSVEDRWHPAAAATSLAHGPWRWPSARRSRAGVMAGLSVRALARSLRRAPSTVSREIRRNGGRQAYRASAADQAAWDRAQRPKRCKLAQNRALARTRGREAAARVVAVSGGRVAQAHVPAG